MHVFTHTKTILKGPTVRLLPKEVSTYHNLLLLKADGQSLRIALADPHNPQTLQYLQTQFPNTKLTRALDKENI